MDWYQVFAGAGVLLWSIWRLIQRLHVVRYGRPARPRGTRLDWLLYLGFGLFWLGVLCSLGTFNGLRAALRSVI